MTKILILADSHTDIDTMISAVDHEKPDMIIHLGDHITDAEQLNRKYSHIQMYNVFGNTDSKKENVEWIRYVEICGKRIMLTHGNIFLNESNKSEDISNIFYNDNRSANTDIILFGHTHAPYLNYRYNRWIMNPGRIGRASGNNIHVTYGILKIDSGKIHWEIIEVD